MAATVGGGAVRRAGWGGVAAIVAGLMVALPSAAPAHEIPSDITVQAFVKPDGQHLYFLVRVPLQAMRDMEFPLWGPGYLDIARADAELRNAAMLWIGNEVKLYENGARLARPQILAARASIPSDRSFRSFDEALAHVTSLLLADGTQLYWAQAMLDVLFEYPITSERSTFAIGPGLERLASRVTTVLRFLPPGGAVRAFEYTGNRGVVRLDPRWHQAALRFMALGFEHILDGIDHLLFLLCLVIPFRRRLRPLVAVVTAFTAAHSITLIASASGLAPSALWFPPLVETLIAASIVYMALENIVGPNLQRRWMITFGFGLVHGFGFSFALRETLQFGGAHMLMSLLSFNVGVELGQLAALLVLVPALAALYRFVLKDRERIGAIVLSALVAHTGWHWMADRFSVLRQYQFQWPALHPSFIAGIIAWIAGIAVMAGVGWLAYGALRRLAERSIPDHAAAGATD